MQTLMNMASTKILQKCAEGTQSRLLTVSCVRPRNQRPTGARARERRPTAASEKYLMRKPPIGSASQMRAEPQSKCPGDPAGGRAWTVTSQVRCFSQPQRAGLASFHGRTNGVGYRALPEGADCTARSLARTVDSNDVNPTVRRHLPCASCALRNGPNVSHRRCRLTFLMIMIACPLCLDVAPATSSHGFESFQT